MTQKKVFLTGVTSFTGSHVAHSLKQRGYLLVASLSGTRARAESDSLTRERLNYANPDVVIEECTFGSASMVAAIKKYKPQVFINHGAAIKGYRNVDFDYLGSVALSLFNAREIFETLKQNDCKRVLHSGSIFEADEGTSNVGMTPSSHAVSIYGASKGMVWQALRYWSELTHLPMTKIVIPNPIGELENADRMIPLFWKMWKKGDTATVRTPHLVRDNLPASWLGNVYASEADLSSEGPWQDLAPVRVRRPSGFVMPNGEFVTELVRRLRKNGCELKCEFAIEKTTSNEPLERFNGEAVPELSDPALVEQFWKNFSAYLLKQ
jgi:UDP-glucose 4-epimerase